MDRMWIITAVVLAFAITSIFGVWLLPILRKLHFGQTILEIGPRWHKNKQGTPPWGASCSSLASSSRWWQATC